MTTSHLVSRARCLLPALALVLAAADGAAQASNRLTPAERAAGWRLLFDGRTLAGWRGLGYDSVPTAHWRVVDGAIVKTPTARVKRQADGQPAAGGDLMTVDAFRDFELAFEWRVTAAANVARPAGAWNAVGLIVRGAHVEHWLNGVKIVEYELGSDDWMARLRVSPFRDAPGYGREPRGHIVLQDHGDRVAYRSVKIRVL